MSSDQVNSFQLHLTSLIDLAKLLFAFEHSHSLYRLLLQHGKQTTCKSKFYITVFLSSTPLFEICNQDIVLSVWVFFRLLSISDSISLTLASQPELLRELRIHFFDDIVLNSSTFLNGNAWPALAVVTKLVISFTLEFCRCMYFVYSKLWSFGSRAIVWNSHPLKFYSPSHFQYAE